MVNHYDILLKGKERRSKTEMATLAELIKGFRANVRDGIPTTLMYGGAKQIGGDDFISLSCEWKRNGFVGLCLKPSKRPK